MAQTILIGLGGTGSRVVNNVVKKLEKSGKTVNDGKICCAVFDTDSGDNKRIKESGTKVRLIPTSKAQSIGEYVINYSGITDIRDWCPDSPEFMRANMLEGASEIRMKSRIAFLDCVKSGGLNDFENDINAMLNSSLDGNINAVIVSSLSGGTGSGMFIQVALWLRNIFGEANRPMDIRGIFLLPDIFINMVPDLRKVGNTSAKRRHYANAYAAIKELNAMNQIMQEGKNTISFNGAGDKEKITVGELFDSDRDSGKGCSVYDKAYFIDYQNANGASLKSQNAYEKMAAEMIYMQLYSPISNEINSTINNNAAHIQYDRIESVYGSCGVAKAEYPKDNVAEYCALRASMDALGANTSVGNWRTIDEEIDGMIRQKEEYARQGVFTGQKVERREEYIRLYEEHISVPPAEAGPIDKFFVGLSHDSKNEKVETLNGREHVTQTDKVGDFVDLINEKIREEKAKRDSVNVQRIKEEDIVQQLNSDNEFTASGLQVAADTYYQNSETEFLDFIAHADSYAFMVADKLFPMKRGQWNPGNEYSIYGLLAKKNNQGIPEFIHPVSARYVLYSLAKRLEEDSSLPKEEDRANAILRKADLWDNDRTGATETTIEEYLDNKPWYTRERTHVERAVKLLESFLDTKMSSAGRYEENLLKSKVYRIILERVNMFISRFELLFNNISDMVNKLSDRVKRNVDYIDNTDEGLITLYVCANAKTKEELYKKLGLAANENNDRINKSIIDNVYGYICGERPVDEDGEPISVEDSFLSEICGEFTKKVEEAGVLNMDLYSAYCFEYDIENGSSSVSVHRDGFKSDVVKWVEQKAVCFLQYTKSQGNSVIEKSAWGYNPALIKSGADLSSLGNSDNQANGKYPKNVLYHYITFDGIEAKYISKFNRDTEGGYYTRYKELVAEMVNLSKITGDAAFALTPHLDKRWHKEGAIPDITSNMEDKNSSSANFEHGFWLAVAYGKLKIDKDRYVKPNKLSFTPVKLENHELNKTQVIKLFQALRVDTEFNDQIIPQAEKDFKDEIEYMTNYVGTNVWKGFIEKKNEMNPITLLIRFGKDRNNGASGARNDNATQEALANALDGIIEELAMGFDEDRAEESLQRAKYRLWKQIYDASGFTESTKAEFFKLLMGSLEIEIPTSDGSDGGEENPAPTEE